MRRGDVQWQAPCVLRFVLHIPTRMSVSFDFLSQYSVNSIKWLKCPSFGKYTYGLTFLVSNSCTKRGNLLESSWAGVLKFFSRKCCWEGHKWFYLPVSLVLSTTEIFQSILTRMTTDYLNSNWLLGDNYRIAKLSATLSPRALENCPQICPRAFWQHPFAPSAESQLIMSLVNLGSSNHLPS